MIKNCLICNKEIAKPSRLSMKDWLTRKKYCSRECTYKALHKGNIGRKTGEHRNCLVCNKKFYIIPAHIKRRSTNGQYCSKACMYKSPIRNSKLSGENHYNWKGKKYSNDHRERGRFRDQIQRQVFTRDNYTCQLCSKRGGYLQVDHIQPWSEYIELRFDIDNCRTLCASCHYFITFGKPMPSTVKAWGQNYENY